MPPTARCSQRCLTSCAGTIPFMLLIPLAERAHTARGMLAALWAALRYCYPLLLVLLLWELVARAELIRPLFLPTVTTVLEQFWVLLFEGEIVAPLLVSLYRAFAGLALAVVFGVLAGLWMARSKWAHWALDPLVSLGFPAPMFAQRFFQTPTVFVYILVMLATGLVLDLVILRLRHWLIPWDDEAV